MLCCYALIYQSDFRLIIMVQRRVCACPVPAELRWWVEAQYSGARFQAHEKTALGFRSQSKGLILRGKRGRHLNR